MPTEEVRVPFALQGCIGTLAGPYDPGTAFVGFYHDLGEAVPQRTGAWGFARGGMGAVTAALRSAAEAVSFLWSPVQNVVAPHQAAAANRVGAERQIPNQEHAAADLFLAASMHRRSRSCERSLALSANAWRHAGFCRTTSSGRSMFGRGGKEHPR